MTAAEVLTNSALRVVLRGACAQDSLTDGAGAFEFVRAGEARDRQPWRREREAGEPLRQGGLLAYPAARIVNSAVKLYDLRGRKP